MAMGAAGVAGVWGSDTAFCEGVEAQYKYVVIGAGLAGFSAVQELTEKDPKGKILLVGKEKQMPYSRPPLSKELFQTTGADVGETLAYRGDKGESHNVYFQTEEQFAKSHPQVTFAKGVECTGLDTGKKSVTLDSGETVTFDQCLLATGAQPKPWPYQDEGEQAHRELLESGDVLYFRTVDDFKRVEKASQNQEDIVVVGGGFLGTELANALNLRAKAAKLNKSPRVGTKQRQVTHVVPEPGVLYRFLPRYLSDFAANKMASHGVDVRTNTLVTGVERQPNGKLMVTLTVRTFGNMRTGPGSSQVGWQDIRKYTIKCNKVVFAVGVTPSVQIAKDAGPSLLLPPARNGF
jgi:programmed cell death 8 (apoptosis-inducing factor)